MNQDINAQLKQVASLCGTSALLDMRDVQGEPLSDTRLTHYLEDWDSGVLLDTHELLICDVTKEGLRKARRTQQFLQSLGLEISIRPATQSIVSMLRSTKDIEPAESAPPETDTGNSDRSAIQQLLDMLVQSAYQANASDIHIETNRKTKTAKVKFRTLGILVEQIAPSFRLTEQQGVKLGGLIVNYEFYSSDGTSPKPFDENIPVDASVTVAVNIGGQVKRIKLRYAHQPMDDPRGLSIVMRLLPADGDGKVPSFLELGYTPLEIALQQKAFAFPHGIVLYTGPTGSGKSTALAAGVSTLPSSKKIISYEDPVENTMPGVCQTQVNDMREETSYPSYARAAVRQDPDVIIYGEIRDPEVQRQAFQQANTGHLVISTLHANSAVVAIERMVDLGGDLARLASPGLIRAIVAQRLVPRLCTSCSLPLQDVVAGDEATDDHRRVYNHFANRLADEPFALEKIRTLGHDPDCPYCEGKGVTGRSPIVEIIFLDKTGRGYIRAGDLNGWLDYLKSQGWHSMEDNAAAKIIRGELCPHMVEQSLETPYGINADSFSYTGFNQELQARRHVRHETSRKALGNRSAS